MNERSRSSHPDREREALVTEDLRVLASQSDAGLPTLNETITNLRRRLRAPLTRKERFMSAMHTMRQRPWLATAVAVAVIAAVLLVLPISYERTTGHDVTLSLAGPGLGIQQVGGVARELKAVLGADAVQVGVTDDGAGQRFTLSAATPSRSGDEMAKVFTSALAARGFEASVSSTPRRERSWGTVYAYAMDRVIRVSMDGKSAAQVEAEIKQRLAEAGITDTRVSVTDEGDQGTKVRMEVKRLRDGTTPPGAEEAVPQLELTKNGSPVMGQGFNVQVMKKKVQGGALTLIVEVVDGAKTARAEIANADTKGDAAVAAEIKAQLEKAGIAADVTVSGDEIQVERKK